MGGMPITRVDHAGRSQKCSTDEHFAAMLYDRFALFGVYPIVRCQVVRIFALIIDEQCRAHPTVFLAGRAVAVEQQWPDTATTIVITIRRVLSG
jgi:hypothetical protein